MNDPFPEHFEIEIDRDRLRRYLRAKWLLAWTSVLTLFGALFGFAAVTRELEQHPVELHQMALAGVRCCSLGAAGGFAAGIVLYFVLSHALAARYAEQLRVEVEGPFLRVRQRLPFQAKDHRLHFRSIVDYAVVEGPLARRFGIAALQMTTIGGGQHSTLEIPGVRNCLEVRDRLSEIDRLREQR